MTTLLHTVLTEYTGLAECTLLEKIFGPSLLANNKRGTYSCHQSSICSLEQCLKWLRKWNLRVYQPFCRGNETADLPKAVSMLDDTNIEMMIGQRLSI